MPYVLPKNVAGQRQDASGGQFESTTRSKTLGTTGHLSSRPSNEQDGSATLRAPLRIAHHPPTLHLCVGPANAARTSAMPDPIASSREEREQVRSREAESEERGARERAGLNHHASMMPAPCPKRSRPGTLQS